MKKILRYHPLTDQSKLKDLGCAPRVYRTRMIPQPGRLHLAVKTSFRKATREPDSIPVTPSPISRRGVLSFIKRALGSIECLPDDKQMWIPAALPTATKIVRRHNVDALLTTGPPMSCHVIGP